MRLVKISPATPAAHLAPKAAAGLLELQEMASRSISGNSCSPFGPQDSCRNCKMRLVKIFPATPAAHLAPKAAAGVAGDGLQRHLLQLLQPVWPPRRLQELLDAACKNISCNSCGPFGTPGGRRRCRRCPPEASPATPAARLAPEKTAGIARCGL